MPVSLMLKLCLMLVGAASVGSVVGVPLALKARGKSSSFASTSTGGGRSTQFSVGKCSSPEEKVGSPITFGEPKIGQVCWDYKDGLVKVENSDDFSSFFSEEWKSPERVWKEGEEQVNWTQQCQSEDSPWTVMTPSEGAQYLGLCGNATLTQTKFVKKVQEEVIEEGKSGWNFWTCSSECWETDAGAFGGSAQVAEKEKGENWKKVEFYKS